MIEDPKIVPSSSHRLTRRVVVAGALGTSALAYAAVRSGVVGGSSQADDGSVKVVTAGSNAADSSAAATSTSGAAATTSDLGTLLTRHSNMLTGAGSYDRTESGSPYGGLLDGLDAQVTAWGKTINTSADPSSSNLWTDDAAGTGSANMTSSFVRLRLMIIQWASPGSSHFGASTVLSKVIAGLQWLTTNRYTASASESSPNNWWDFEIGSPLAALDAIAVLRQNKDATDWSTLLANINARVTESGHFEGGNAVWLTRGRLLHAIVAGDTDQFGTAVTSVKARLAYVASDANGFRPDNSFVEHRTGTSYPGFAYTGGYGMEAYFTCAWMTYLLAGPSSTWLAPADFAVMLQWMLGAVEPLLYRGAIPGAVMGRNVSRNYYPDHYVGYVFLGSAILLAAVSTSGDATTLKSLFNTQVNYDTARPFFTYDSTTGLGDLTMYVMYLGWESTKVAQAQRAEPDATFAYPGMDRLSHRRPGWAFTVANCSTRILTYEAINAENVHGWYQGNGMTYFYNQYGLDDYQDAFWPTVDPYRLPGTTIDKRQRNNGDLANTLGGSALVGGVGNGNCGAGMMTVSTDGGSMQAKKSWIFLGDYIVCQGSGITSTSGSAVETVVENRNLGASGANAVQLNSTGTTVLATQNGGDQSLGSANWVHIDGIGGYVFPAGTSTLRGLRESRSHAWSEINTRSFTPTTPIQRNYITLYLSHGASASNQYYSYVFMPNASAADTAAAFTNGTVTRQAKSTAHAAHANLGTQQAWGAVFWQSDTIDIFTANAPVCVIVRQTGGHIAISVSDPTQAATGTITITISIPNSGVSGTPDTGLAVSRNATSATLSFTPSQVAIPGGGAHAVLNT